METTRPFAPGVIDYDGRMSVNYPAGRALSADAAGTWCATLEPFLQQAVCPRIVDVGAGTGCFSALFARSFQAHVIGIEPARGMLSAGAATIPANLAYVAGRAERLPLRDK